MLALRTEPGHGAECVRHKEKIAQGERERTLLWKKVDGMADDVSYIRGSIDTALRTNGRGNPGTTPPSVDAEAVTITIPRAIFLAIFATILGAIATYLTILR